MTYPSLVMTVDSEERYCSGCGHGTWHTYNLQMDPAGYKCKDCGSLNYDVKRQPIEIVRLSAKSR